MSTEGGSVARNHKARRDYLILESMEAGIELQGTEVKSMRAHRVNIDDAFARIDEGQLFVYNMHISPYEQGNRNNHAPTRVRRLLLHKREIMRLGGLVQRKGCTLVPLAVYFKKNLVKVEIALAQGKQMHDRREDIKRREDDRQMQRAIRRHRGG